VGAACAAACARERLRVAVVECGPTGGGATAAGMGHIVVMDDSEAQFALTHYSRRLWQQLAPTLPPRAEYFPCGTLWVAADREEMEGVWRKHRYYAERKVATEVLEGAALATAEPNLRPGMAGALLVTEDSVVYPPVVADFLIQQSGASLFRDAAVEVGAGRLVTAGGLTVAAPHLVLAAGTAVRKFLPAVPVQPRKGHLLITDRYPGFVRHQLVELGYLKSAHSVSSDSVAFNVQPRPTGQVLVGSSRQYGVESAAIDEHILSAMLARALHYMPAIARLNGIRAWTGFRASTPDKLPLIGRWPGDATLWLAAGHEGLGITTALGTAELVVNGILDRQAAIPAAPYSPARSFAHHG
jgi:D-hydroxyproline dehydrogenase subunit beta